MQKETVPTPAANESVDGDEEVDEVFKYEQLVGHDRTNGSKKSDEQLRMEYIQRTDSLIHKMTQGIDVINPHTGEKEQRIPTKVIWLDKSARPLAWFTRDLWDRLATDPETGETPPMPDFRFLNIDKEQWVNTIDPEGNGNIDIDRVDPSILRSLRSIFVSPAHKRDGLTEAINEAPTELDNAVVMVVDEVYSSGRTLDIATKFIQKTFPSAYVGSAYWMQGIAMKGLAVGNADLPVWYKKDEILGRGVGDRHATNPITPPDSVTQRLGRWFLSTRFEKPDEKALQLRKELHHLAVNPDVPIRPSMTRDDAYERLESYNDGRPAQEVLKEISEILAAPLGKQ